MHEQSLVRSLLRQVNDVRRLHPGGEVAEVRVEVGPLSGVEPALLISAFEHLVPDINGRRAALVVDEVPLIGGCQTCQIEFEIEHFRFQCPTCGGRISVTSGDAVHLISVSMTTNECVKEDSQ